MKGEAYTAMKMRSIRYIFKEGFVNVFQNMRMFAASCGIVAASLIVIGIFMIAAQNIDENVRSLGERPQIQVFCRYDLGDAETEAVESWLRSAPGVREFTVVGKEDAYERARELLGDDARMLDDIGPEFLPISFIVKMDDPGMIANFVQMASETDGVADVSYERQVTELIANVWRWTKAVGFALAAIPMLLAAFIMTNAVKLAVHERRAEISIMRYIGATEQLIMWPFVVEGIVVGLFGAAFAYMLTAAAYAVLERRAGGVVAGWTGDLLHLVPLGEVAAPLFVAFVAIGVGVGAAGSLRSVRKYLKV